MSSQKEGSPGATDARQAEYLTSLVFIREMVVCWTTSYKSSGL
jgi:hypothetical protein